MIEFTGNKTKELINNREREVEYYDHDHTDIQLVRLRLGRDLL